MNIRRMLSDSSGEFGIPHFVIYKNSLDVKGLSLYEKITSLVQGSSTVKDPEILIIYPFYIKNAGSRCVIPAYDVDGKVREYDDEFLFQDFSGLREASFALLDYLDVEKQQVFY